MKKNRNPERTKTLKEKGKIPFRYRFFLGGASFFLALMILVTGVAFAFRETIDLYLSWKQYLYRQDGSLSRIWFPHAVCRKHCHTG